MSWRGACWRQLAAAVPAPRVPAATLACFTAARQTVGAGPAVVGASRRRVPPQALLVRTGRRCMSSAPALATKAGPPKKRRRGRERHAGSTATVKPGDWHCPNCGGMNFASRTSCFGCGAPKPEELLGLDLTNTGFRKDVLLAVNTWDRMQVNAEPHVIDSIANSAVGAVELCIEQESGFVPRLLFMIPLLSTPTTSKRWPYLVNVILTHASQLAQFSTRDGHGMLKGDLVLAAYVTATVKCMPATYNRVMDVLLDKSQHVIADIVYRTALRAGVDGAELSYTATEGFRAHQQALLSGLEDRRKLGWVSIAEYNGLLKSMLGGVEGEEEDGTDRSQLFTPAVEQLLGSIVSDHYQLPQSTTRLLIDSCTDLDALRQIVDEHFRGQQMHWSAISRMIETFIALSNAVIDENARTSRLGPDSWWLLATLKEMTRTGQKIQGWSYIELMQLFAEKGLLRHAAALHSFLMKSKRIQFVPLREETLLRMIRMCSATGAGSRWSGGALTTPRAIGQPLPKNVSWSINRNRRHDKYKIWGLRSGSKFACALWYQLERMHHNKHPDLDAHLSLLQVACERGDVLFMRQVLRLIEGRFQPSSLDEGKLHKMLLAGSGLGGDARAAMEFAALLPAEEISPDDIFKCINDPSDFQHLASVVQFCWARFYNPEGGVTADAANPAIPAEAEAALQVHVTKACRRIVQHMARRTVHSKAPLVLLPVPDVAKLILPKQVLQGGDLASAENIVWLPEAPAHYLSAPTRRRRNVKRRADPMAKTMIRAGLMNLGADGEVSVADQLLELELESEAGEEDEDEGVDEFGEDVAEVEYDRYGEPIEVVNRKWTKPKSGREDLGGIDNGETANGPLQSVVVDLPMEERVAIAFGGKNRVTRFVAIVAGDSGGTIMLDHDASTGRYHVTANSTAVSPPEGYTTLAETLTELELKRQQCKDEDFF